VYSIEDATKQFPLVDFKTYFTNALLYASPDASGIVIGSLGYIFNLKEPDQLKKLSDYLTTKVQPRTILNYFYLRLLRQNAHFVEENQVTEADVWIRESEQRTRRTILCREFKQNFRKAKTHRVSSFRIGFRQGDWPVL
jgi:hypothetical protein